MLEFLNAVNRFVWGVPALLLIMSVGLLLSVRTRGAQFRLFPAALRRFALLLRQKDSSEGVSSYNALCTALAATVGTGNIAGVAGAIALGGPGAIFWMWICALFGMVTKFAEAVLSVRYRIKGNDGNYIGGPMYIVQRGMGKSWHILAGIYCFFGVVAAFGVGSATQINAVLGGINGAIRALGGRESAELNLMVGIVLAILIVLVLYGGAKRIGTVAAMIVPFASVFYILMCLGVLIIKADAIPKALLAILEGAVSPNAVTGGMLGSAFAALRVGASRGVFTNEAGMGTAGIAHASAQVSHPVEQGLMGIVEVFLDTIVICTMTALAILCSGIAIPFGNDMGIHITADAFSAVYGNWICIPLAFSLCSLAIATIIGWGLYGTRCAQFLFGERCWRGFAILQSASVVLGAVLSTGTVWSLSETANGLMAIPNLIILIYFCPEVVRLTAEYKTGRRSFVGGTYEDINQCKPLRAIPYEKVSPACSEGEGGWKENLPS